MALYTSRALAEGDEVCLDYGSRSNGDWLLHYGLPARLPIKMTCSRWEGPMQSDGATCPCSMLIA